jgi:hypothetical protein
MVANETAAMTEASSVTGDEMRIDQAADAIRGMTKDVADELPVRPWVVDTIRKLTVQAPLQSLAIAFLLGAIVARRRR